MQILCLTALEIMLVFICIFTLLLLAKDENKHFFKRLFKYCLFGSVIGLSIGALAVSLKNIEILIAFTVAGLLSSEILLIFNLISKRVWNEKETVSYYDDGTPPKFYITGDKHRDFQKVKNFCKEVKTRKKDVLIILGDSGFNYYEDERDDKLKSEIAQLNITLFCLHGNKENRPQNISTYGIRSFCGGKVYYEPQYPNIYFAIDGEVYTFEGKKYMVIGGAHSIDKMKCIKNNLPYWEDEMPDALTKAFVEDRLCKEENKIYGMLTHTCPIDYLPTEMFMSTKQNAAIKRNNRKAKSKNMLKPDIDRSTEIWLGEIEKKLNFDIWFCGHYHIDKQIDDIHMLYNDIRPLHLQLFD